MVPLVAACALFCGIWRLGRSGGSDWPVHADGPLGGRGLCSAALLVASSLIESPPWSTDAPLLVEAQLDAANSVGAATCHRLPRAGVSRREGPRQHGLARALHAGALPRRVSRSPTSSTKATARSGNWRSRPARLRMPAGCWSRRSRKAATSSLSDVRRDHDFTRGMTKVCEGGGVSVQTRSDAEGGPEGPPWNSIRTECLP